MSRIDALLRRYPLVSDQVDEREVAIILAEMERTVSGEGGAVVEFGCYAGTTSLFIRRLLDTIAPQLPFHVYDSFAGLPPKAPQDASPAGTQFVEGELQVSKKQFLMNFKKARLRPPVVHKAWFDELSPEDVPERISFAFLDGDYYHSVRVPLRLITPRLSPGATIIVDDYANEALPGARRAVDEWLSKERQHYSLSIEHSLAVIRFTM